jgi:hypothetical protein
MADALTLTRRDTDHLPTAELIRRERQPLPRHDLDGCNYRRWAAAVCGAEVKPREADFARVERLLGFNFDRWTEPTCETWGQFQHELFAGAAMVWLSHLQTHESEKRTPWSFVPFCDWRRETRAAWLQKRRDLWRGFINAVRKYQAARSELDAFLEEVK